MAEIEFKRRGTPVWAVVLAMLVIAAALYVVFGRGGDAPAPAVADSTATAPTGPAAPGTATPAAPAAPAAAATPHARYAAWVDSASLPAAAAGMSAYAGSGLQALAEALQEKAPMAGVQHVMIRAMADTVVMPSSTPRKQLDATQAAFFATAFALRDKPGGALMQAAAQRIQLTSSLVGQRENVKHFFEVARDVLRDPSKGPPPPPGQAPAPAGKS